MKCIPLQRLSGEGQDRALKAEADEARVLRLGIDPAALVGNGTARPIRNRHDGGHND